MSKDKISAKQEQILNILKENILKKGYPPTVREICEAVGLSSTSSVHAHLNSLEEKGYIRRDPTKPRAIEILDDDGFNLTKREIVNVPVVGTVAAGQPIFAEENITDYFPVPPEYFPVPPEYLTSNETFMLKVRGDSMINAGILYGDTIIVEQTNVAKNGDIVVALIEDSATVKTYYKENGHYRLQPENDTMDPIIVDDLTIIGKVIGLFRSYKY